MTTHRRLMTDRLMPLAVICCFAALAGADERTLTPEQMEELAAAGELSGENQSTRPAKLPDLTKGELIGEKVKPNSWHLGPTGVIGYLVGGLRGDKFRWSPYSKVRPPTAN